MLLGAVKLACLTRRSEILLYFYGRFLDQLIQASEDFNVENFSQHCFDYDQVSLFISLLGDSVLTAASLLPSSHGHR